jgi:hypothetical protein
LGECQEPANLLVFSVFRVFRGQSFPDSGLTVAVAAVLAAAFSRGVTFGTGLAAVIFAVFDDVVAVGDFAVAVSAGALGNRFGVHDANI